VLGGNVTDQLLDNYSFADTGAAEEPDFAPFGIWLKKVDDFNAGLENSNF